MSSTTEAVPHRRFFADSRIVRASRYVIHHTGLDKFFLRFVTILIILFGFYNPTQYSYANWIFPGGTAPLKAWIGDNLWEIFVGILFLSAAIYLIRTTHKALGPLGTLLIIGVLAAATGLFAYNFDVNWTGTLLITLCQIGLAIVLTVGLLSANLNRRISGQITTVVAGPVQTDGIDGRHHGG